MRLAPVSDTLLVCLEHVVTFLATDAVPFKGPLRKSTIGRGKRLDQSRSTIFDPPKRPNSPSRLKPLKARVRYPAGLLALSQCFA
jgi:hypothetical protein